MAMRTEAMVLPMMVYNDGPARWRLVCAPEVKAADGKQTVGAYLKSANTTVKGFTLYVVGEGIEKKVDDFAAEVAAQVAAAKGA